MHETNDVTSPSPTNRSRFQSQVVEEKETNSNINGSSVSNLDSGREKVVTEKVVTDKASESVPEKNLDIVVMVRKESHM